MDGKARHFRALRWAWICVFDIKFDQLNAVTGTDGVARVTFTSNDLIPVIIHRSFVRRQLGLT